MPVFCKVRAGLMTNSDGFETPNRRLNRYRRFGVLSLQKIRFSEDLNQVLPKLTGRLKVFMQYVGAFAQRGIPLPPWRRLTTRSVPASGF